MGFNVLRKHDKAHYAEKDSNYLFWRVVICNFFN